jgi:nucleotide-binding universal stress UspA family protein
MTAPIGTGPRILVGVDDSPAATAAVRWAAELAHRTGGQVALLHVRPRLLAPGLVARGSTAGMDPAAADALVAELAAGLRGSAVDACAEVVDGDPARVLIARSARVDLLVLGGESRRRQRGLLLGAVAQQCTRRAHCPVVLVPPPADLHPTASAPVTAGAVPARLRPTTLPIVAMT